MSATIVGSLFTLLANLPITSYTNWLAETGFGAILSLPAQATVDLIALYASFFVAYSLAKEFKVDGAGAGLASLVSFMLVTGRTDGAYATAFLGAKGLFTAMIVGLLSGSLTSTPAFSAAKDTVQRSRRPGLCLNLIQTPIASFCSAWLRSVTSIARPQALATVPSTEARKR